MGEGPSETSGPVSVPGGASDLQPICQGDDEGRWYCLSQSVL